MKKELIAGILLAAVFAAALFNISVSKRLFSGLEDEVREVYELAAHGEEKLARSGMDAVTAHWERLGSYTRVFIGYTDIDSVNSAIFEFGSDVYSGDTDSMRGSYGYLISCIDDLIESEGISLRSIF